MTQEKTVKVPFDTTINLQDAVLAVDIDFIYNNWETPEDFIKEFQEFTTVTDKANYFYATYGKKYKEQYGDYPKIVLKS